VSQRGRDLVAMKLPCIAGCPLRTVSIMQGGHGGVGPGGGGHKSQQAAKPALLVLLDNQSHCCWSGGGWRQPSTVICVGSDVARWPVAHLLLPCSCMSGLR